MNILPLSRWSRPFRNGSRWSPAVLLVAFSAVVPAAAQQTPNEVAIDRCESQLTYQIGRVAGGSVPDAGLDVRQARLTRVSATKTGVAGNGWYRRDRYDRGRPYDYKCVFNARNGAATASYRWTGPALGWR